MLASEIELAQASGLTDEMLAITCTGMLEGNKGETASACKAWPTVVSPAYTGRSFGLVNGPGVVGRTTGPGCCSF